MSIDLYAVARAWMADDPDPVTREATQKMLDARDEAALAACFGARLSFGTAGLRGPLGPGPNRMNRAWVRRVAAGLGRYLLATAGVDPQRGVVIGYDGRHGSRAFAEDSALVLASLGLPCWLYDHTCPTPQLAHAVGFLHCAAGVMVTASHNPPQDNGYKVYWGDGAQIIPPHDSGISAAVETVQTLADLPLSTLPALRESGLIRAVPPEALAQYQREVAALRLWRGPTDLRVVYTAMHGVGRALLEPTLRAHGYTDLHLVEAQAEPNPDFPTVSFPNPEEPGALDLAFAKAREVGADLLIANDPDADRLAVALPDGQGGWRALTGNQVGCLIADELLRHGTYDRPLVATTIVSTGQLKAIAAAYGAEYREVLTGFKWIANAALQWPGDFVMGFEEALGYSVGPVVRDKDGVSAALIFCDLAARAKAEGETVFDRLEDLARRFGLYATSQYALTLPGEAGAAQIQELMRSLRDDPPTELAGRAIEQRSDLLSGQRVWADGRPETVDLPASNVLAFELAGNARLLARPSGTEPKVKFYFEVCVPLAEDQSLQAAQTIATAELDALQRALRTRLQLD